MRSKYSKSIVAVLCVCLLFASFPAFALQKLPQTSMQIDSSGEHVRLLQENLKELSFFTASVDGNYGAMTASGVKQLQSLLNIPANGICDSRTILVFNAALASHTLPSTLTASKNNNPALPFSDLCIGIDAGHQQAPDSDKEPVAPDSEKTKERMSQGAIGIKTEIPEYETTLLIAKKLKTLLEDAGATVVMSRTKNDVRISNAERAVFMNEQSVDFWVRVHCDFSKDKNIKGTSILVPSPVSTPEIAESSLLLAKAVLPAICKETGSKQLSIIKKSDQTAFNWSKIPVITIEFGFLSNPQEDVLLNRDYYQTYCARGVLNGLMNYYQEKDKETEQ